MHYVPCICFVLYLSLNVTVTIIRWCRKIQMDWLLKNLLLFLRNFKKVKTLSVLFNGSLHGLLIALMIFSFRIPPMKLITSWTKLLLLSNLRSKSNFKRNNKNRTQGLIQPQSFLVLKCWPKELIWRNLIRMITNLKNKLTKKSSSMYSNVISQDPNLTL